MTKKTCRSTKILKSVVILFTSTAILNAKLVVKVDEPKRTGEKAVIKLTIKNTFKEKVESARASVLLLTDDNRLVGQASQWVIGGTRDKPALAPGATNTFNFVVPTEKPFTKT